MQVRRNRSYRRFAVLAIVVFGALLPSVASADPTFSVMNAAGGIYWRSAPDWNTAEQISGFGFYDGTTISVQCYQSGAGNVPGSADTMWEQATDVAGPGYGSGWINEHFINDGQPINQPSPGVPPCNQPPPPPASITASLGGQYGCGSCNALNISVQNFPTGTFTYYCHDNSGPGGSDTVFFSHAVSVTDPNQSSWPGVFCYDSGPYTAYLVMNGVTSNSVNFGPAPPPTTTTTPPPTTTTPPPTTTTPNPPPDGNLVFSVTDAAGGIYYRSSPHWSDTPQTPGVGVYDGDRVQLICGAPGDAVGPASNTAWSYVTNLSRNVGSGWVNEHFINDGAPADGFVSGEPACGSTTPGGGGGGSTGGPPQKAGDGPCYQTDQSVFYSPTKDTATGVSGISVAQCNLLPKDWKTLDAQGKDTCLYDNVLKNTPSSATILSGWSNGRLGPLEYLAGTPTDSAQWNQIQTIVLFDPGSYNNFTLPACDGQIYPQISWLLDEWLKQSGSHHLLVLAGEVTEDASFYGLGSPQYHGLWHYYFPDIWADKDKSVHARALVCDYYNYSHEAILSDLSWVANSPPTTCPWLPVYIGTFDAGPTAWNP